jgi:hypothetical protein
LKWEWFAHHVLSLGREKTTEILGAVIVFIGEIIVTLWLAHCAHMAVKKCPHQLDSKITLDLSMDILINLTKRVLKLSTLNQ